MGERGEKKSGNRGRTATQRQKKTSGKTSKGQRKAERNCPRPCVRARRPVLGSGKGTSRSTQRGGSSTAARGTSPRRFSSL
eukprot:4866538-Heterocapsa_arctica.AAC.1